MPKENEITESTRIPLGPTLVAVIFVCGMVLWAGRLEWVLSATAKNQEVIAKDLSEDKTKYTKDVEDIKGELLMIKCHLKVPDPRCIPR